MTFFIFTYPYSLYHYIVLYIEHDAAVISFNITIGYKDTSSFKKGKWSILAEGHVSRVMTCTHNDWVSPVIPHALLCIVGIRFGVWPSEKLMAAIGS